jgi:hypothetical protein
MASYALVTKRTNEFETTTGVTVDSPMEFRGFITTELDGEKTTEEEMVRLSVIARFPKTWIVTDDVAPRNKKANRGTPGVSYEFEVYNDTQVCVAFVYLYKVPNVD